MKNIATRIELAQHIPALGISVELGVAGGMYSCDILRNNPLLALHYAIDKWNDHHNAQEEELARMFLEHAGGSRVRVLRSLFAEAVQLFKDEHFDFVYIDGYAHTGQDNGTTLRQWWPKCKRGGIFAGHDYHPRWPQTMDAVNDFCCDHNLELGGLTAGDEFPSWWLIKP